MAGGAGGQRDHGGPDLAQDASHRGRDHQRRCDLRPDRPLSPHPRARRRLLLHGEEQPADAGSRHRPGLPAGFPPLRSGRPRLTWLGSRRSRRGTAASRSDAWSAARALPPLSASGRVCARSAASSDDAACAARTASRSCTPSPACRASAPTPPHCSISREGIGASRTACTTSAIGPAARTPAAPDPATPPRPSPPCETPPSPSIDAGGTVPSRARSTSPNIATRRSPSSNKREPNDPVEDVARRARHLGPCHHQVALTIALPTHRHSQTPTRSLARSSQTAPTSSTGCYVVDRIKHPEPIRIRHLSIGVLGGVQPDKLSAIIEGPDDGLASRLVWAWPDAIPAFTLAREVANDADACAAFRRLADLAMDAGGSGHPEPKRIRLTADAEDIL